MATVTVNTLEFVSALRALIPISKQATLYSGEKERMRQLSQLASPRRRN